MRILANHLLGFSYSDDEEYIPTPAQLAESAVVERYLRGDQAGSNIATLSSGLLSFPLIDITHSTDYVFDEPGLQYVTYVTAAFEVPEEYEEKVQSLVEDGQLDEFLKATLKIGPLEYFTQEFEIEE